MRVSVPARGHLQRHPCRAAVWWLQSLGCSQQLHGRGPDGLLFELLGRAGPVPSNRHPSAVSIQLWLLLNIDCLSGQCGSSDSLYYSQRHSLLHGHRLGLLRQLARHFALRRRHSSQPHCRNQQNKYHCEHQRRQELWRACQRAGLCVAGAAGRHVHSDANPTALWRIQRLGHPAQLHWGRFDAVLHQCIQRGDQLRVQWDYVRQLLLRGRLCRHQECGSGSGPRSHALAALQLECVFHDSRHELFGQHRRGVCPRQLARGFQRHRQYDWVDYYNYKHNTNCNQHHHH